jgi:hypothetical protein
MDNDASAAGQRDRESRPVHYTVFIRLPFRRDDFEDPPIVNWDAGKDTQLWKIIAKADSKELDWEDIASRFRVTLPFLLQQAAHLYDRHFEAMRGVVNRLSVASPNSATISKAQVDGPASLVGMSGGVAMQRTGSKGARLACLLESDFEQMANEVTDVCRLGSRNAQSPIITIPQRDTTTSTDGSIPAASPSTTVPRSAAPTISRTPSSATVTQSKVFTPSVATAAQRALRGLSVSGRRPPTAGAVTGAHKDDHYDDEHQHEGGSSSDSEDDMPVLARSRYPQRPPLGRLAKKGGDDDSSDGDAEAEDDDNDSNGSYLPFAASEKSPREHPSATLRDLSQRTHATASQRPSTAKAKSKRDDERSANTTESSASSMSRHFSSDGGLEPRPKKGPLSPQHRAQLASLSPRSRGQGSEGSPSMGSSFSDLDDISQSALDEAVLSNMRQGGSSMASRMSTLRDALGRRG